MYYTPQNMHCILVLLCLAMVVALVGLTKADVSASPTSSENYVNNESVKLFQQYIQINTTTYGDLSPAVEFWETQAESQGVQFTKLEFVEGFPVLILKWEGTNSSLGSIMLNSHMDVVAANEEDGWTYPPFSAHLDEDGVIWGRGSQDMKSVAIQYFEALKRLKANNVTFLRDMYMTIMPDEEVGGPYGMQTLLKSQEFADMNVGLELDEGGPANLPVVPIFYQDKVVWQIQIDCYGIATHGSTFDSTNSTAVGKCYNVMDSFLKFREEEYEKSVIASILEAGTYTSVNLNVIKAGDTTINIVPGHVTLAFDIRLATTLNEERFEAQLNEWISSAGDNITLNFIQKDKQSKASLIGSDNPYFIAAATVFNQIGLTVVPIVSPGSTDGRFVRNHGIPAFGFSPMPYTDNHMHGVDERLAASTFLRGIDIYESLIPALANTPGEATSSDPSVYVFSTTDV